VRVVIRQSAKPRPLRKGAAMTITAGRHPQHGDPLALESGGFFP
jgi:hypothetical protein